MKTVTFYSYKGGVGRSLALANVANRLSEFGKKVCIIDFDLEAPGLHLKFAQHIAEHGVQKGLVDYIQRFSERGEVASDIWEYVTQIDFKNENRTNIALVAAGNTRTREYWKSLNCIDWKALFYEQEGLGVEFFLNMKAQIQKQIKPDILLIDSRTGITDISGITMSLLADEVVLLAANNRENLEGIAQVVNTLSDPLNSFNGQIPKMNFVLTRIPYFSDAKDKHKETNAKNMALKILNAKLESSFQIKDIDVIHSDPELELKEQLKISYSAAHKKEAVESPTGLDYLNLFETLTEDMISSVEKEAFDDFINVQSLIEKAASSNNYPEKINFLTTALQINPESGNAHIELAMIYYYTGAFNQSLAHAKLARDFGPDLSYSATLYEVLNFEALHRYDEAQGILNGLMKLVPQSEFLQFQLARILYSKHEFDKTLEVLEKLMSSLQVSEDYWNLYAITLSQLGRYDQALEAVFKALEIAPQHPTATGSLGEIYAAMGNDNEFFKNLELSFIFGMDSITFNKVLAAEKIYTRYYHNKRFLAILKKYNIVTDWLKSLV